MRTLIASLLLAVVLPATLAANPEDPAQHELRARVLERLERIPRAGVLHLEYRVPIDEPGWGEFMYSLDLASLAHHRFDGQAHRLVGVEGRPYAFAWHDEGDGRLRPRFSLPNGVHEDMRRRMPRGTVADVPGVLVPLHVLRFVQEHPDRILHVRDDAGDLVVTFRATPDEPEDGKPVRRMQYWISPEGRLVAFRSLERPVDATRLDHLYGDDTGQERFVLSALWGDREGLRLVSAVLDEDADPAVLFTPEGILRHIGVD